MKTAGKNYLIPALWIVGFCLLWSLGSAYSLPSLGEIPGAWMTLLRDKGLIYELWVSIRLNLEAIALSMILSVGFAYLTVKHVFRTPVAVISKFRFFGMAGFVIIFTRIFGGGHALKVALLVFGMSTFFVTSMVDVVSSLTKEEQDLTRSLRMGSGRAMWEVIVRGRLDLTFDALRQNAAIGWMMLTMVEGLVKFEGGIGVIMLNESKYRNLAAVFAAQLTVLTVGIAQDLFLGWLKNRCCPHTRLALESK